MKHILVTKWVIPHIKCITKYKNGFPSRTFSNQVVMNVFDRKTKLQQKERQSKLPDNHVYDYLKREIGWRVADRVLDIKRQPVRPFDSALDLGCSKGFIDHEMIEDNVLSITQCDMSYGLLSSSPPPSLIPTASMVVDEERLPFRDASFDLVLSNLSLHWVNDLPGTFKQIHRILEADGCLLGSMFGGDSLHELRISLGLADLERKGGYRPHISPYTSAQDLGSLLQQAGFVMLTIDVDDMTINYPSMIELMQDLKGMGESGCAWSRSANLNQHVLLAAAAIYREKYGVMSEEMGHVVLPALFQSINFIAWKPHQSQLKPAKRGSGSVSMKDLAKVDVLVKEVQKLKGEADGVGDAKVLNSVSEIEKSLNKIINNGGDGGGGEGGGGEGGGVDGGVKNNGVSDISGKGETNKNELDNCGNNNNVDDKNK